MGDQQKLQPVPRSPRPGGGREGGGGGEEARRHAADGPTQEDLDGAGGFGRGQRGSLIHEGNRFPLCIKDPAKITLIF